MTYLTGQPFTSPLQVGRPASEVRIEKSLIGLVLAVLGVFFYFDHTCQIHPITCFLNINNQLLPLSLRISIAYQQSYACRVQEVCRHESC